MPDETPAAVSPTGQVVGLSALLAKAPPWVMNALLVLMGLAGAVETVAITAPDLLPAVVLKVAHVTLAVGAVLGMASPGARKAAPLVLLVLSLGLSGCTATKAFVVTGATLDEVGAQYEVASPLFFKACESKRLDLDTCRHWRDFASRFQVLYRPSSNAWHAAAILKDAVLEKRYTDMVGPLLAEFADLYGALVKVGLVQPNSALVLQ